MRSNFSSSRKKAPVSKPDHIDENYDLKGLNLVAPDQVMPKGETPFAVNNRRYADNADETSVAMRTRQGSVVQSTPVGEAVNVQNTNTGTGDILVDLDHIVALPFTAASTKSMTMLKLFLKKLGNTRGFLIIEIYNSFLDLPGQLIGTTSIAPSSITETYAEVLARIMDAPTITSGDDYFMVAKMQELGAGAYYIQKVAAGGVLTSDDNGDTWTQTTYGAKFKVYGSTAGFIKGFTKRNPENAPNRTLFGLGTKIYEVPDSPTVPLELGTDLLDASSDFVRFLNIDERTFIIDQVTPLRLWDGTYTDVIQVDTFYVDGHTSVTDPGANWTSDANAFNGNTSDGAIEGSSNSTTAAFYLEGIGTNASGVTGTISQVRARVYAEAFSTDTLMNVRIRTSTDEDLGTATGPVVMGFGSYTTLSTPTGGWTLAKLQALKARAYNYNAAVTSFGFALRKIELEVTWDTGADAAVIDSSIGEPADLGVPVNGMIFENRLLIVPKGDQTRIDFTALYDFVTWPSDNFFYIGRPLSTDWITAMAEFREAATVFTREMKYTLTGTDIETFQPIPHRGTKGAISQEAIAVGKENIYFMADDLNIYAWNGSSDTLISRKVRPELKKILDKTKVRLHLYNNQLRVYYNRNPDSDVNCMLLFDIEEEQWYKDTGRAVMGSMEWAFDNNELIEFSSKCGWMFQGERGYSDLGKPISFKYWTAYNPYGSGAAKDRIKKFRPIVRPSQSSYYLNVGKDVDFRNQPVMRPWLVDSGGAPWGTFNWGDGTSYGGAALVDNASPMSGRGKVTQYRFEHDGIEQPTLILGYIAIVKIGRAR